jgi:hypothetical protein
MEVGMASAHPLVGSWRVTVRIPGTDVEGVNLATCGADGTMIVAFPSPVPAAPGQGHRWEFYTPAIGSWLASGERGATMTFVSLATDENGASIGSHTVSAEVTVDASGASWTGPFRIEAAGPAGEAQGTVEGTVSATRIVARGAAKG